jgi:hypothetical protein
MMNTAPHRQLLAPGALVASYERRRPTRDRILTRLFQEVGGTDGAVALASAILERVQAPALDVRVRAELPTAERV